MCVCVPTWTHIANGDDNGSNKPSNNIYATHAHTHSPTLKYSSTALHQIGDNVVGKWRNRHLTANTDASRERERRRERRRNAKLQKKIK